MIVLGFFFKVQNFLSKAGLKMVSWTTIRNYLLTSQIWVSTKISVKSDSSLLTNSIWREYTFSQQVIWQIVSDINFTFHCRIQRGRQGRPPGFQILSFSCSLRQQIWKIITLLGVGPTPSGKSWIRHCFYTPGKEHSVPTGPEIVSYWFALKRNVTEFFFMQTNTKSLYKTMYAPVRSECSSCSVFHQKKWQICARIHTSY